MQHALYTCFSSLPCTRCCAFNLPVQYARALDTFLVSWDDIADAMSSSCLSSSLIRAAARGWTHAISCWSFTRSTTMPLTWRWWYWARRTSTTSRVGRGSASKRCGAIMRNACLACCHPLVCLFHGSSQLCSMFRFGVFMDRQVCDLQESISLYSHPHTFMYTTHNRHHTT